MNYDELNNEDPNNPDEPKLPDNTDELFKSIAGMQTDTDVAWITMFEMYQGCLRGGFSREDALRLLALIFTHSIGGTDG